MKQYTPFNSKIVALPNENVDTDQIIPARFLKVTDKDGNTLDKPNAPGPSR